MIREYFGRGRPNLEQRTEPSVDGEALSASDLKGGAISEKFIRTMDTDALIADIGEKISPYLALRQARPDGTYRDGGYPEVYLSVQKSFSDREMDLDARWRENRDFLRDVNEAGLSERGGDLPERRKALDAEYASLLKEEKEIVDLFKSLVGTAERIVAMAEKSDTSHDQQCQLYQKGHSLLLRINEMLPGILSLETRIGRSVNYGSREYERYEGEKEAWRVTALNHSYIKSSRGRLNDAGFTADLDLPGELGSEAWYKNLPAYLKDFHGFLFIGYPSWKEQKKKKNQDLVDFGSVDLKYTHFDGAIFKGAPTANFAGANLEGASFREATFRDPYDQLQDIKAPNADFTGAHFDRTTRMHHADLRGTIFDRTRWATYESSNEQGPYTEFDGSDLTGARFCEAHLGTRTARSEWEEAAILGASFANSDLKDVDFTGAHLEGCEFYGAQNVPREVRRHLTPGAFAGYVKYLSVEGSRAERALLLRRASDSGDKG